MIEEIAAALAEKLSEIEGIKQVVDHLNTNPSTPSIDIYPADPFATTDESGFGPRNPSVNFIVRARVNATDHEGNQRVLLRLMDDSLIASSVGLLLEDDQTLNGLATSVDVEGPSGFRHYVDVGGVRHGQIARLGVEWTVRVLPAYS